jgi:ABC-type uncharacterized transport system fused permease/ATPase subunit
MNLPTDLQDRQQANRKRRKKTAELTDDLDRQPIILDDIQFQYAKKVAGGSSVSRVNLTGKITLQQGTLSGFIGDRSEGKTTLLRILGGVILPDDGLCFIPSHLRVLHVSAETFFYRGTLMDNVLFGVDKDNIHREQAQTILNMFAIGDHLQHYVDIDEERPWAEVLSQSECQILNLTRAFVFNPEVLCIDKPTSVFNEERAAKVMDLLKEFVSNKGLGMESNTAKKRRPRTAIMATERSSGLKAMDKVFKISVAKGIEEYKVDDATEQQQVQRWQEGATFLDS